MQNLIGLKSLKSLLKRNSNEKELRAKERAEAKLKKEEEKITLKVENVTRRSMELLSKIKEYDPSGPYDKKKHEKYHKNRMEIHKNLTYLNEHSPADYEEIRAMLLKYDPFLSLNKKEKEIEKIIISNQDLKSTVDITGDNEKSSNESFNLQGNFIDPIDEMEKELKIANLKAAILEEENKQAKQRTILIEEEIKQRKMQSDAELALVEDRLKLNKLREDLLCKLEANDTDKENI